MLDDEKCLCGSGRLYSMCCKPFSGQGIENYKKEIDSKNYIKAYYVAVAMLSDYLEDVRKHTNRILKDNPVIGRFVLHKDVNALSELELEKKSGKIMRLLNKLSPLRKYLILQPQLNGIGINVEKILEDLKK